MTEHTSGPWTVLKESDRQGFKGIGIKSAQGTLVANLIFQLDDRETANARLIAAAPEMLEALKYALQESDHSDLRDYLARVIAKAEGLDK